MGNLRKLLLEANELATRLERLRRRIGKALVDALRSEINDIKVCEENPPNYVVLEAPTYSGYWNVQHYLRGELVPLHTIFWEIEEMLFNGNQRFYLTTPNGIYLTKDKARRVREILLQLLDGEHNNGV